MIDDTPETLKKEIWTLAITVNDHRINNRRAIHQTGTPLKHMEDNNQETEKMGENNNQVLSTLLQSSIQLIYSFFVPKVF